jgi:hypothetical protein
MADLFWIAQMQQYASRYAQFVEILTTKVHMTTEDILPLWLHLNELVCDCEGCREETDCIIHIDVEDFDSFDDDEPES